MKQGIIFNIQRYTIHDGPGIRTEIFMKGCPLRCKWCSNPESHKMAMEPGVYPAKCIGDDKCGFCIQRCKQQALLFTEDGIWGIDRSKCVGCLQCADACPTEAIKSWGQRMSVEDVMKTVRRDRNFYEESGGGITISGGEPLLQKDFVAEVLKACQEEGIHTCLESTFYGAWEAIEQVLPYADLLISDLKSMDTKIHQEYTGVGCESIHENLKRIAQRGHEMILRIPVIPGVNDNQENMAQTADFIEENIGNSLRTLQLLSFMHMGEEKCRSLDREYLMKDLEFDREEFQKKVETFAQYFNSRGIYCVVGTKEK